MAFINTTSPAEAEGEIFDMYERQQEAWGYVPDYALVFSHRPEVLARWGRLLAEIKRPMSKRRFELVTFAAALELRNTACSLAHGTALTEFFSADDVRAMKNGRLPSALTAAEREMLAFSRKVAADASSITPTDMESLKHCGLSDAEIFDVAATAAGRAFFTKLLDALGVQADSIFARLDRSFVDELTVGRPVAAREPEHLPARQTGRGPAVRRETAGPCPP